MYNLLYTNIKVRGGKGGNGSKSISLGDRQSIIYHGGNGGNGGRVIFQYHNQLLINNDIIVNKISAENGHDGKHGTKDGKNGKDLIFLVTMCTELLFVNNKKIIIDKNNQQYIINGGQGGLGSRMTKNSQFTEKNLGSIPIEYIITLRAILPSGDVYIYDVKDYKLVSDDLYKKFGYKSNIQMNIICIHQNNEYKYIIPCYKSNTISILSYISNINKILFYSLHKENKNINTISTVYDNVEIEII
jgi:hypothetical protein